MRDRDVRDAVRRLLHAQYANDPNTKIVEEMGVWSGSVRIDLAVINGELSGYELKSDQDTLERLPLQARLYSRVFDRITLVVGRRHAEKAGRLVPKWWGITIAEERDAQIELTQVQDSQYNPSHDPYLVAQLLWKDEALAVLERFNLVKGWRSKRIKDIHQRLATELRFQDLATQVRNVLKNREGWLGQPISNERQVSVNRDLNPIGPATRPNGT